MATKTRKSSYRADKKAAFVREYLRDYNGAAAARRAGYSARTSNNTAIKLLKDPVVIAMLREAEERLAEDVEIEASAFLQQSALIATSDIRQLFNSDGTLKAMEDWPDSIAACVSSVETFEEYEGKGDDRVLIGYVRKVKLWDKNNALDRTFKHKGLFPPKQVEHGEPGSFKDMSLEERKAAARDLLKRAVKSGLVTILPTGGGRKRK